MWGLFRYYSMFNWKAHLRRTSKVVSHKPLTMKYLIVGLGNPGSEYAATRHNVGFDVLNAFAETEKLSWEEVRHGHKTIFSCKGRQVVLLKPNTFMNLSGKALNYWMQQEKIPIENVLVVVDDLALPLGALRVKPKGGDAGHNGLKNIQEVLGRNDYARLRFGIGSDFPRGRQVDYVLGKWSEGDKADLALRIPTAIEIIKSFALAGLQTTMNAYNNK